MELVPIIYNSLLVVFSLLAFVIVISLISSKLFFKKQPKNKGPKIVHDKVKADLLLRNKTTIKSEVKKKEEVVSEKSYPKIEKKLVENKKVKVFRRSERREKESKKNIVANNNSRYSIVNTTPKGCKSRKELYQKFSKMSIEYSQSA